MEDFQILKDYKLIDMQSNTSSFSTNVNSINLQPSYYQTSFSPIEYELSCEVVEGKYKYNFGMALTGLYHRNWEYISEEPLNFTRNVYVNNVNTGQDGFEIYKCEADKLERVKKEIPYKVKMCGGIMQVNNAMYKGVSFRQSLFGDSIREVSHMFAYLISWGHSSLEKLPNKIVLSCHHLAHYSCYNIYQIETQLQTFKKIKEQHPQAKLSNAVSTKTLKLTLLTMRKTAEIVLSGLGKEIESTKARLVKAKKKKTKNIYDNWMLMEDIFNYLFAVSEDEIETLDEEQLELFCEKLPKLPNCTDSDEDGGQESVKFRLRAFFDLATKKLHPLSSNIVDAVYRIIPEETRSKMLSMYRMPREDANLYWMVRGSSWVLTNLTRNVLTSNSKRSIFENKKSKYATLRNVGDRVMYLWNDMYLIHATKQMTLYDRTIKSKQLLINMERGRIDSIIDCKPAASICYCLGRVSDEHVAPRTLFAISIPKKGEIITEPKQPRVLKVFESGIQPDIAIYKDNLVVITIKNGEEQIEAYKITDDGLKPIISTTLSDHCPSDATRESFLDQKKKISNFSPVKAIANNSHVLLTASVNNQEGTEQLVYAFNYQKKSPLLLSKFKRNYKDGLFYNTPIRVANQIGHITIGLSLQTIKILLVQKENLVTAINQKFPSFLSNTISSYKKKGWNPWGQTLEGKFIFIYDNRFQRLNAWFAREENQKLSLKVAVFQIRF